MRPTRQLLLSAAATIALIIPGAAPAQAHRHGEATPELLVTGLDGGGGSTVGPDGALYVTEGNAGRISRVDPRTGAVSFFADGLPKRVLAIGGAMDVAFLGHTAYAIVTLVGPDVGGTDVVGLYRVDGPHTVSVVADIGAWSIAHPPTTSYFVPSGVQYAMQPYGDGFLVTDGHHNRVLDVTLDGQVREVQTFANIVPTGLETWHHTIYVAEAGPVPHDPADGKVVSFRDGSTSVRQVAHGAPLLVDVELGAHGRTLYALAQGDYSGAPDGSPALPDTGTLVRVDHHGGFDVIARELDRPTSMEVIGHTAYVVTLDGEIWTVRL